MEPESGLFLCDCTYRDDIDLENRDKAVEPAVLDKDAAEHVREGKVVSAYM